MKESKRKKQKMIINYIVIVHNMRGTNKKKKERMK